jgi:DNA primase
MKNSPLIYLVDSILGYGKSTSKGNKAYYCPKCHHHKLKLEINLDESSPYFQSYNCWTCGFKGKKLSTLFKKVNVDSTKINQLKLLIKSTSENKQTEWKINEETKKVSLPKEFISLINPPKTISTKHALHYLKTRNVEENDIIKYNIGYCEYGPYSNMIIIPSYDNNGDLNYFISRSYDKNSKIKHRNPDVSRDIIGLELFINWNVPIILCEGMFDAIAIKRNVIPLLGKTIQNSLMKKIINSKVQKIYIALDKDAIKQALNFCEQLMDEGKEVYLVDINEKDPSEMGFVNFTNLIQTTLPLTFSNLLEKKMQII